MSTYTNDIKLTAGFNFPAKKPLDDRLVIDSYDELINLSKNIIYNGMIVSVVSDKNNKLNGVYQYLEIDNVSNGTNKLIWRRVDSSTTLSSNKSYIILSGGSSNGFNESYTFLSGGDSAGFNDE